MTSESNALPIVPALAATGAGASRTTADPETVILRAEALRRGLTGNFRDEAVSSVFAEAEQVARRAVKRSGEAAPLDWDQRIDRIVTSPVFGLPIMLLTAWRERPATRTSSVT